MNTSRQKYTALLLSAALAAAVFTGCQPRIPAQPSETAAYPGGLAEDGKGTLQEMDLLGEWLYTAHGCILRFEENGICNVMYEGTDYPCTYRCENDQVLLFYEDQTAAGEIREDNLLYFNGSVTGFLTAERWEQEGIANGAYLSLENTRSQLQAANAAAGILYFGYHENLTPFEDAFISSPDTAAAFDRYAFLPFIEVDCFARNDGSEIYCIIPADESASVTVTAWDAETGTPGRVLYEGRDGRPFWVQGNISDILPNLCVTIEDNLDHTLRQYHPSLSLKDGTVSIPGPLLVDLTEYPFPVEDDSGAVG